MIFEIISLEMHYTFAWYQTHVATTKVIHKDSNFDPCWRILLLRVCLYAFMYVCFFYLSLEWGISYDIRVNGIATGPINNTTGMRKLGPDEMMPLFKFGEK
ncbi:putative 2,4-dienoyl-CoA reductase ((2E)-enoyl-CoA-producing) [Helianthus debilis subsp. tardiflorus]